MELPKRKRIRLGGYDYSAPGYYFITVCTEGKRKLLCDIEGCEETGVPIIRYSEYGRIVREQLEYMANFYSEIKIDKYVVMPNHIHMILRIPGTENVGSGDQDRRASAVSRFVGTMKRFCNMKCGRNIWQARSYDHVIRGEADYIEIWEYIEGNPSRWTEDKLFCDER